MTKVRLLGQKISARSTRRSPVYLPRLVSQELLYCHCCGKYLSRHQQAWIMTVMPAMCDHHSPEIQSRAIHALGDLVLIKGLRHDETFLSNVTELLVRKTNEVRQVIFHKQSLNVNAAKMRNDLIYGIACLADAMRSTMLERANQQTPFVFDVFAAEEIAFFYQLMDSVKVSLF